MTNDMDGRLALELGFSETAGWKGGAQEKLPHYQKRVILRHRDASLKEGEIETINPWMCPDPLLK